MGKIREDMVRFTVTVMAYTEQPEEVARKLELDIQRLLNRTPELNALAAPIEWRPVTKKTQMLAQALADSWTKADDKHGGEQNG